MRFRLAIAVCLLWLLAAGCTACAETLDYAGSRHDYAQAVSALNRESTLFAEKRLRGAAKPDPGYTLVLFRTRSQIQTWDAHQPDVLAAGPHGCYTAAYGNRDAAVLAVEYLKTLPDMLYAELDAAVHSCSEEPSYAFHSHGAAQMGFADAVPWTIKAGTGNPVTVAVIDSGVYPHPLLAARLNGSGYDYVDGDDDATSDTYGHGTHVAGIIADCTPDLPVRIRPIRVLNASGKGSISNTVSAVYEAAEAGVTIINMSLVSDTHSEALEDAVAYATGKGTAVVISAGNSGELTSRYCPVHMEEPGLIVVGACSGTMDAPVQASYSNYGASVDVYAFGTSIESCSLSGGYSTQTGTSQAAPHVSALCAVLKLLFPSLGGSQLETRVKQLAGDGEVNVPDASLLKPLSPGMTAECLTLPVGAEMTLVRSPLPALCGLTLQWTCDHPDIATVDTDGVLHCISPGVTTMRADGSANADMEAVLNVVPAHELLDMPSSLKVTEEEAMAGTAAAVVRLPAGIERMSPSALSDSRIQTVIYPGTDANIPFDAQGVCWVVPYDPVLIGKMDESGIPYLAYMR